MANKKEILLVEDNSRYASVAKKYLASRKLEITHARDYSQAVGQLKNSERFSGVITDLFFPDRTGSKSITLGIGLVDRIIGPTPVQVIKSEGSIFAPPEDHITIDYNTLLMEAMEKSEANQPLGIAIAETAKSIGLPYVIATSTYHHDNLTQPFCNKGWNIVDCNPDFEETKEDRKFWERALGKLEEEMLKLRTI